MAPANVAVAMVRAAAVRARWSAPPASRDGEPHAPSVARSVALGVVERQLGLGVERDLVPVGVGVRERDAPAARRGQVEQAGDAGREVGPARALCECGDARRSVRAEGNLEGDRGGLGRGHRGGERGGRHGRCGATESLRELSVVCAVLYTAQTYDLRRPGYVLASAAGAHLSVGGREIPTGALRRCGCRSFLVSRTSIRVVTAAAARPGMEAQPPAAASVQSASYERVAHEVCSGHELSMIVAQLRSPGGPEAVEGLVKVEFAARRVLQLKA
jgi:hypothetical protein